MTEDFALLPGTQLDHYRITTVLGRGGFGITYQAWDDHLNRLVAIKEYFPHGQAVRADDGRTIVINEVDPSTYRKGLDRFLTEARTLAQFRDPRIVHVHGFKEAFNTAYMVMDFADGVSLRDHVLHNGPLSAPEARRILIDILRALQVIHSRNYLHRDIKPANVMRRPDGSILLLDFGSARFTHVDQEQAFTVVVTPGYAPMEQYSNNETQGPSTDLYAVGACLLFCLTVASPVDAFKRTIAIQSNEVDPLESVLSTIVARDPGLAELHEVLRWLLQSQAQHRPQSAGEVLQRLGTTMAVPLSAMNPSSQQQTVILDTAARRPDTVDLSGIRSIPSKLVEPMRLRLEALVGARATQILFQAIRSARNAQELVAGLGEQLANDPLRDQALAAITQLLVEGTRTTAGEAAVAAAPRATPQTASRSPVILKDEESSNLLSNELAKYIGPIARMLLKKRLAKATSIDELISQLEHEIPVDSDRVAFRKAVRTMKLLPS